MMTPGEITEGLCKAELRKHWPQLEGRVSFEAKLRSAKKYEGERFRAHRVGKHRVKVIVLVSPFSNPPEFRRAISSALRAANEILHGYTSAKSVGAMRIMSTSGRQAIKVPTPKEEKPTSPHIRPYRRMLLPLSWMPTWPEDIYAGRLSTTGHRVKFEHLPEVRSIKT